MSDYIRKALKDTLSKGRVYVDSPEDAPDDASVEEGPEGGYYYESEGGSSEPSDSEDEGEAAPSRSDPVDLNLDSIPDEMARDAQSIAEDGVRSTYFARRAETVTDERIEELVEGLTDDSIEITPDEAVDLATALRLGIEANMDGNAHNARTQNAQKVEIALEDTFM